MVVWRFPLLQSSVIAYFLVIQQKYDHRISNEFRIRALQDATFSLKYYFFNFW